MPLAAGVEENLMPMRVLVAAIDIFLIQIMAELVVLIRIMVELVVQNFFRVTYYCIDLEFLSSSSLSWFQLY